MLPISSTPLPFQRNFTTLSSPGTLPEYSSATVSRFNRIHGRSSDSQGGEDVPQEELFAWRAKLDQALDTFNSVRAAFGETIERELQALSRPALSAAAPPETSEP